MAEHPILEYFESRRGPMIDMITELVEIESPSRDMGGSSRVVDKIAEWASAISPELVIERTPAEGYGEHLAMRAFPDTAKPIMILGHTDTVHPLGSKVENPTRVDGDLFYGCGIFDMKANIVVMLEAIRYYSETGKPPARPVNILLTCDEEVGSYTGRELVEREASLADHCLILEPSAAGRVKTGRKGTGMYTVKAHGIPAHAGLDPEKGASAILDLSRQIERLHELNDPSTGTTVNVCTIVGGTTTNVIPEHAECAVDVRFESAAEAERVDIAIKALKPFDERVSLTVTGGINRPPLERTEAVAALFEKARSAGETFGYELGEMQVGGASDGNFVAALGVPVLDGLGITGDGAHTLREHILVSDIPPRAALVTSLIAG
ncbi:MAG: M20 family metallopeptidase [Pyrinomonadaceae bacterium]